MPAGLAFATCLRTAALLVRKLNTTEQEGQEESAQVFARRPSDLLFSHANRGLPFCIMSPYRQFSQQKHNLEELICFVKP